MIEREEVGGHESRVTSRRKGVKGLIVDPTRMETGVSYFSSRDSRHFEHDLADMVEHHCTYIVHCYTETDMLWNRGNMEAVCRATRDAGLEVWADPWGVAGIFSGETLTRFVSDHPETGQLLSDGRRVPVACPSHPATRAFLQRWIRVIASAGAQVTFWDEPHLYSGAWSGDFSGAWACICEHCGAISGRTTEAGAATFSPAAQEHREAVLLDFLAEMCAEGRRAGLLNALCLLPSGFDKHGFPEVAAGMRQRLVQRVDEERLDEVMGPLLHFGIDDWSRAAAIADLDIFGTDPYWFLFDVEPERFMRSFSQRAIDIARAAGRRSQLWLQAFAVPEGREDELAMGTNVALELGADSLAAWSYRGTGSMSKLACARPDVVWQVLGDSFAKARSAPGQAD